MTPPPLIAVPVHYRSVRVRQISPFHWALLRAVQVFPAATRPPRDELTRRLGLGDPLFLNEAWRELLGWHTVDDTDFALARLTLEGEAALREGVLPQGPAVDSTRLIHFTPAGQWVSPDPRRLTAATTPLPTPPPWAGTITARQAEHFLRAHADPAETHADEHWQAVRLAWKDARTVILAANPTPSLS